MGQKNVGQKKSGSKKIWVKKNLGQIFFVHESSSWVKIGLHAENQLPGWSGSGLKVTAKLNNKNTEFHWVFGGGLHTHNLVKPTSTSTCLSWVLTTFSLIA